LLQYFLLKLRFSRGEGKFCKTFTREYLFMSTSSPTPQSTENKTTFADLQLVEPILRALTQAGYVNPTPIQLAAIPHLLKGKDLLGCAQTGTGKTAAFALPMLQYLSSNPKRTQPKQPRALILTPTRELAIQIEENFRSYGQFLKLKTALVFGGVSQGPQVKALAQGVDVLVATPGRLKDLINQRYINLQSLEIFVLDEADRMLDMGFIHDIKKIITMLPQKRQNLFFSATMPADITKLASTMLVDPVRVEVTPVSSTAEKIVQSVMFVDKEKKRDLLRTILKDKKFSRVIVFTRTKHGANKVVEVLTKNGITSEAIHGNKSQNARQKSLDNFKKGRVRILVATDIAARGIDIDDISHVINFEIPNISESYVHRIGRTARAGAQGIAISFCDAEERAFLRDIEKLIGRPIPVDIDQPYHSTTVEHAKIMSSGKAKALIEGSRGRRPQQGRNGGGRGRPNGGSSGGGSGGNKSRGPRRTFRSAAPKA
jgi:ATP-dependent RNA helicase RhlE